MRLLNYGSRGPAVQLLQLALRRAGYEEIKTDGIFGAVTQNAVRRFQYAKGLNPDGIVGQLTRRALTPWYLGSFSYTVRSSETLWKLSRRFGISLSELKAANPNVRPEALRIGSTLTVPYPFPVVPTDIAFSEELIYYSVNGLKRRYPFIGLSGIGTSVMGKPLRCIQLGNGENRVLYNGAHHANEWITAPVLLKFVEELCRAYVNEGLIYYQSAKEIFDYATIAVIPAVDPDGAELVTGELKSGEFYNAAVRIAEAYPQYPFPSGWKANIRGIDLNLQYPAGWEQARENKFALGIISPAPADYVGASPLTAPEARAMYEFTKKFNPALTLSYHTQGEVIYWKYSDYEPFNSKLIANAFSQASGYAVEDTPFASGFAGYKDWFISEFNRPGYTIEAGRGTNPLPLSQFNKIYSDNLGILTLGMLVT